MISDGGQSGDIEAFKARVAQQARREDWPFAAGVEKNVLIYDCAALRSAAADPAAHAGKPARFSGRITEVCQKQGCWVVMEQDGRAVGKIIDFGVSHAADQSQASPALASGELDQAAAALVKAESELKRAAAKGVIPNARASRKTGRMAISLAKQQAQG